jgi:hypothetical protein
LAIAVPEAAVAATCAGDVTVAPIAGELIVTLGPWTLRVVLARDTAPKLSVAVAVIV